MPEIFAKFGGHKHAAGLTLAGSNVEVFRRRFQDYAAARLTPEDFCSEVEIDGMLALREINERTATEIAWLAPFGCGHPVPVFAVLDVEVAGPPVLWKEKHLRVPLRNKRAHVRRGHQSQIVNQPFRLGCCIEQQCLVVQDPARNRRFVKQISIVVAVDL